MAYKRHGSPIHTLQGEALTASMIGIGMLFGGDPVPNPNIEDTLLAASVEGMERGDLRVLSVLLTWLEIHVEWINADRLTGVVIKHPSERVRAFWGSVARWQSKDRRFARMARAYEGPGLNLLATGTEFHLKRSGMDPRFMAGPLRVPAGVLRNRPSDVLSPGELAHRHAAYRRRVMMGPSYRADMWAELDQDPDLSCAELARRAYGSYATAWQVKRDWGLLKGA